MLEHRYDAEGLDITAGDSSNPAVYTVTGLNAVALAPGGTTLVDSNDNPTAAVIQIYISYHNSILTNSTVILNKGF
jgi:hypothetical protein